MGSDPNPSPGSHASHASGDVELVTLLPHDSPGSKPGSAAANAPVRDDTPSSSEGRHRRGDSNLWQSFTNTFIAFIGAGILGLPYAFKTVGVVPGCLCLAAVAGLAVHCMLLVVQAKDVLVERDGGDITTPMSYGQVGRRALGPFGGRVIDVCLVITQAGFSTAYLIFIASNMNSSFPSVSKQVVILCALPVLYLFSTFRQLKHLAFGSAVANAANVLGLMVVFFRDMQVLSSPAATTVTHADSSLGMLPFFFGIAVYCYEGVGMVLPIRGSMKEPSRFRPLLVFTITVVTTIYCLFGALGYLAFGDNTAQIVTLNLESAALSAIVKVSLCVGLYLTYPVMMVPVNDILERAIFSEDAVASSTPSFVARSRILRVVLVTITAWVAAAVPNFGDFLSLIGSSCCAALAFVIPAIVHLKIQSNLSFASKAGNVLVVVVGVFSAAIATHDSAVSLLHHYHGHPDEPHHEL